MKIHNHHVSRHAPRRAGVKIRANSSSRSHRQNNLQEEEEDDRWLQNSIYAEEAKTRKVKQKDDSGGSQDQGGQKGEGDPSKNMQLRGQSAIRDVFASSPAKINSSLPISGPSPVIAEDLMVRKVDKKLAEQKPKIPSKDVFAALRNAQRPGVFWRSHNMKKDGAPNPELLSAVQEAHTLLPSLPGIESVTPGYNEKNEGTIIMVANRNLSLKTIQTIPREVGGFRTTVSVQYDFLPLKVSSG